MPKIKSDEKTTIESEQSSQDQTQQPAPVKEGRPVKIARAPMAMTAPEGGAAERAQQSGVMQETVGNKRLGEMMSRAGQGGTASPAIQRETQRANPTPPISTPLPAGTQRNRQGAATLDAGGVPVTVTPDTTSRARHLRNRAETRVLLNWRTPNYRQRGEVIESVDPVPRPTVTVGTTYGRGVTSQTPSAYGRGTTREDIAAEHTSLGFHEGSHGTNFLDYLNSHPLPQFSGRSGMSVQDYQQAVSDYNTEMQQYQQDMEAESRRSTDCVGIPGENCGQ
jgi:hypothetical protein